MTAMTSVVLDMGPPLGVSGIRLWFFAVQAGCMGRLDGHLGHFPAGVVPYV
jgi:hypothetical protein